ncbi:hypothetical protein BU24DRAFT_461989 [Aaosphaeria arxii CBS 175.79]|uniref:Uncharacterized protein n=1 Tax=Aaosphaeria arxii CBS 175.79 TaxID=1450172 RepID=A0A6A5XR50_9PLEO|nr:uncharacterized protein BU24DRAFT_461989 [Aaosphaeria arxii CBS 175.79]KAF2015758.1 hypothetical protein BU24DRAFT_461989 [Aaosphaeria arxii CBS 175.79]
MIGAFSSSPMPPPAKKLKLSPPADYPAPTGKSNDPNYPQTWTTLYLPYHTQPRASIPTSLEDMLSYTAYAGQGALKLNVLICEFAQGIQEESEEAEDFMLSVFLCWPFNVTSNGRWKQEPIMAEEELEMWMRLRMWKANLSRTSSAAGLKGCV